MKQDYVDEMARAFDNPNQKGSLLKSQIVYDKTVNGRRLIAVHHKIPASKDMFDQFNDWYCGYMQIKPSDKEYKYALDYSNDLELDEAFGDPFPSAIGGITWTGPLPECLEDDGNYYVGFDTNHFNTQHTTKAEVIDALLKMKSETR